MKYRAHQRGSILVMSIFFLLILFLAASSFLVLLPVESRATQRTERLSAAALTADAGINESLAWLRFQLAPNGAPAREPMAAGVYPNDAGRTTDLGNGWTYRWSLVADSETFPNGSHPIRAYTIVSKAFKNGVIVREARAEVIQESLSHYAELYDYWPSNLVKPLRSTSAPAGGPVHVNDVLRMWIPEGSAFWSSDGDAVFSHGITASGTYSSQDGFAYYQGNWYGSNSDKKPYNDAGPIASRYARMAEGGRDNVTSGAGDVPLPTNSFQLRDASWGFSSSNPIPSSAGVYLNEVDGHVQGIYIEGDVQEMQLGFGGSQPAGSGSVAYGDNSWVKVEQPIDGRRSIDDHEAVTVVTIDENSVTLPGGTVLNGSTVTGSTTIGVGSTLVRSYDGTFTSYPTELNGVIYAKGDVHNLWGVNKGRRTVAVEGDADTDVSHKIIIGGKESDSDSSSDQDDHDTPLSLDPSEKGLVQYGAVDDDGDGVLDPPTTADNVLGLIGKDVLVSRRLQNNNRWDTAHTETNPLYIFATVLGGITGEGGSYKVQDYNEGYDGWVYKYGSRIMVDAGAWGTTSGHGLIRGNTFFDAPAVNQPPPYFPAKPTFVVKSYEEVRVDTGETL
jgi:hypothetical protein